MVKINCRNTIETPQQILLKTGLWPTLMITKWGIIKLIFNLIFDLALLTLVLCNIIKAIKFNNLKLLNWMTGVIIPLVNYYAKSFTLIMNKKCFLSLMEDLKSEVFNSHNEKLNEYVELVYRFSNLTLKCFAIAFSAYIVGAGFLPIIINVGMMLPAPFDTGKFDIFYKILHFLATIHLAVNSACFDVLFLTLMGLCTAQLNILEDKLMNILEDVKDIYGNMENLNLIIQHNLKENIILHALINKFVKKLSVLLSFPLFIQYTCGCIIICNTILQMTIMSNRDTANLLSMSAYSAIIFGQMMAYHWFGNEVTFKSNKIIESCYISRWYEFDMKSQKHLILLMERAKRPLTIELYKFIAISLDSLGTIVRWAYSVFALLKARYS